MRKFKHFTWHQRMELYRYLYIDKLSNYSSYLKLHGEEENVVARLDEMVESGKYNRFRFDAEAAVKRLMGKKAIRSVIADKAAVLEQAYTKERGSFARSFYSFY